MKNRPYDKNLLNFGLAVLATLVFLSVYVGMGHAFDMGVAIGRVMPAPVIETQPQPTMWTKGYANLDELWCEVSSSTPERHWCDYVQQRAEKALKIFCADAQHAVQCEGI